MTQLDLSSWRPRRRKSKAKGAQEWKIVSVRETAPERLPQCDIPQEAVDYWRAHIATAPHFNPDVECLAVLLLNVKMRVRGHHLVSIGSLTRSKSDALSAKTIKRRLLDAAKLSDIAKFYWP